MRCRTSSPTSIKLKALGIATSSDVNTDELAGSEKDRVSRPDTNAQPTPSLVFGLNWRSYRRKNFTQYALAGDLSNGVGRDPVKNLFRLVLAKYFLR